MGAGRAVAGLARNGHAQGDGVHTIGGLRPVLRIDFTVRQAQRGMAYSPGPLPLRPPATMSDRCLLVCPRPDPEFEAVMLPLRIRSSIIGLA